MVILIKTQATAGDYQSTADAIYIGDNVEDSISARYTSDTVQNISNGAIDEIDFEDIDYG